MKRQVLISLLFIAMLSPLYSQEKKTAAEDKEVKKEVKKDKTYTLYQEIVLEDFETSVYTDKNLSFQNTGYQEAKIAIRDQTPAPTANSRKYLGVKVKARNGDSFTIKPPKELNIDKYCKSIAMWVYGKNISGILSILVTDSKGQNHKLRMGFLNFLGWKKLEIPLTKYFPQQDDYLNLKSNIKIIQIHYTATNQERLPRWQTFYIDQITATVRDKYDDKQSDEW